MTWYVETLAPVEPREKVFLVGAEQLRAHEGPGGELLLSFGDASYVVATPVLEVLSRGEGTTWTFATPPELRDGLARWQEEVTKALVGVPLADAPSGDAPWDVDVSNCEELDPLEGARCYTLLIRPRLDAVHRRLRWEALFRMPCPMLADFVPIDSQPELRS